MMPRWTDDLTCVLLCPTSLKGVTTVAYRHATEVDPVVFQEFGRDFFGAVEMYGEHEVLYGETSGTV